MWRESLCVGVDIIDNQHKQLFKKIEELLLEVNNKSVRNKVECIATIIFLKDYVVKHFADEEACMKSINYEDFEYHKALHEKFITTVAQHEKKMLASDFSDNDVK
ncbi:MAG: hemerythrin domain-containing protein, partial [Oscillospiraceae bacterium]|nr:hemerythrin domain-containing protein [Oscillospiraceae bacterium]